MSEPASHDDTTPGTAATPPTDGAEAAPEAVLTPYERMGGHETFATIVKRFYENVRETPDLHALYPLDDMEGAEDRLRWFLEQYWGGPTTYQDNRGHPRLRMRHAPFKVTPTQRDNWLRCMHEAVGSVEMDSAARDELWNYLVRAADAMVNAFDGEDMTPPRGGNLL